MPNERERMLKNYRGRRYMVCTAIADVRAVIDSLGIEDGSVLPPVDGEFNPVPPKQVRDELNNMATALLRLVLILNDGHVSADKLNAF